MSDIPPNGKPLSMLETFFLDWQHAQRQLVIAQNEVALKEARFKGAAELIYGPEATWEYNEQTGLRFTSPPSQAIAVGE